MTGLRVLDIKIADLFYSVHFNDSVSRAPPLVNIGFHFSLTNLTTIFTAIFSLFYRNCAWQYRVKSTIMPLPVFFIVPILCRKSVGNFPNLIASHGKTMLRQEVSGASNRKLPISERKSFRDRFFICQGKIGVSLLRKKAVFQCWQKRAHYMKGL